MIETRQRDKKRGNAKQEKKVNRQQQHKSAQNKKHFLLRFVYN